MDNPHVTVDVSVCICVCPHGLLTDEQRAFEGLNPLEPPDMYHGEPVNWRWFRVGAAVASAKCRMDDPDSGLHTVGRVHHNKSEVPEGCPFAHVHGRSMFERVTHRILARDVTETEERGTDV